MKKTQKSFIGIVEMISDGFLYGGVKKVTSSRFKTKKSANKWLYAMTLNYPKNKKIKTSIFKSKHKADINL